MPKAAWLEKKMEPRREGNSKTEIDISSYIIEMYLSGIPNFSVQISKHIFCENEGVDMG